MPSKIITSEGLTCKIIVVIRVQNVMHMEELHSISPTTRSEMSSNNNVVQRHHGRSIQMHYVSVWQNTGKCNIACTAET